MCMDNQGKIDVVFHNLFLLWYRPVPPVEHCESFFILNEIWKIFVQFSVLVPEPFQTVGFYSIEEIVVDVNVEK